MKIVYALAIISFIGGLYFQSPPYPGESKLHYTFAAKNESWQYWVSILCFSFCIVIVVMNRLMKNEKS
jgi:hypothetical protein